MSSARLQGTRSIHKSQLYFYIVAKNLKNEKKKFQLQIAPPKTNKILRNKVNKSKRLVHRKLQNAERNERFKEKKKTDPMFMDPKT